MKKGIKSNLRRVLAFVLAITFVMSTITLVAGAESEPAGSSAQIPSKPYYTYNDTSNTNGYYTGTGSSSAQVTSSDGMVTAEKTIAPTENENEFIITLEVTTKTEQAVSPDTAVVLVIDISRSMDSDFSGSSRMQAAKNAAKAFVNAYVTNAGSAKRWISIVMFGLNAEAVDFDSSRWSTQYWIDAADDDNKETVLDKIEELSTGNNSGTFLAGGLTIANNLFTKSSLNSSISTVANANRYAVVLTDGAPTAVKNDNKWGNSDTYIRGKYVGENDSAKNPSKDAAATLRGAIGGPVYTIAVSTTPSYTNWLQNHIAENTSCAFSANDISELNNAFSSINQSIAESASAGTLVDTIGANVNASTAESAASINTTTGALEWDLADATPVVTTDGNITTYTYTTSYKVTLDTDKIYREGRVGDHNYATNGQTTFTYNYTGSDGSGTRTLELKVPTVKALWGSLQFTKVNDGGQPLAGAEFTLSKNGVEIATATSGSDGVVSFNYIPKGTYTLTETTVPTGYNGDTTVYSVTVANGQVTTTLPSDGKVVNNIKTKDFTVEHYFETGYDSDVYERNTAYDGQSTIAHGETRYASVYIKTVEGFTYDSTVEGSVTQIKYSDPEPLVLRLYYRAVKPDDKTFFVEHYFETGYNTGSYVRDPDSDDQGIIEFGQSKSAEDFVKSVFGYTYKADHPDGVDSVSYDDESLTLKLFYSVNKPGDKNFTVKYYFETDFGSDEFTYDSSKDRTGTIEFGDTIDASAFADDFTGYWYDSMVTGSITSITYDDADQDNLELTLYYKMRGGYFYVEHYFENGYNANSYTHNSAYDSYDVIRYGETKSASAFVKSVSGYTYNASVTGSVTEVTYNEETGEDRLVLKLYYRANKPGDRTFTVEHYYETGFGTGVYGSAVTYAGEVSAPIAYGETKFASDYITLLNGYRYDTTVPGSVTEISYDDSSRVLKLYYRVESPADKSFTVEHYFENGFNTGIYVRDPAYDASGTIAYGQSVSASGYVLDIAGFEYDATVSGSVSAISYGDTGLTLKLYYRALPSTVVTYRIVANYDYYFNDLLQNGETVVLTDNTTVDVGTVLNINPDDFATFNELPYDFIAEGSSELTVTLTDSGTVYEIVLNYELREYGETPPPTGVDSRTAIFGSLAALSGSGLIALALTGRKKEEDK